LRPYLVDEAVPFAFLLIYSFTRVIGCSLFFHVRFPSRFRSMICSLTAIFISKIVLAPDGFSLCSFPGSTHILAPRLLSGTWLLSISLLPRFRSSHKSSPFESKLVLTTSRQFICLCGLSGKLCNFYPYVCLLTTLNIVLILTI